MLFLQTARHPPESCAFINEKAKKANLELMAKMGPLLAKHGIKLVGAWVSLPEHLTGAVYDAPSMEALVNLSMEPEAMTVIVYNISEVRPVLTLQETMKLLMK